jgi:hypothetical protein
LKLALEVYETKTKPNVDAIKMAYAQNSTFVFAYRPLKTADPKKKTPDEVRGPLIKQACASVLHFSLHPASR